MLPIINLADRTSQIIKLVSEHAQTNGYECVFYPECGKNMEEIQLFITQLQTSTNNKPASVITDSILLIREIYLCGIQVEWRNWTTPDTFTFNVGTEPDVKIAVLDRELKQSERYIEHELHIPKFMKYYIFKTTNNKGKVYYKLNNRYIGYIDFDSNYDRRECEYRDGIEEICYELFAEGEVSDDRILHQRFSDSERFDLKEAEQIVKDFSLTKSEDKRVYETYRPNANSTHTHLKEIGGKAIIK